MTLKVIIEHDEDTSSPAEDDGQWTLYSFSSRHVSYRDPESLGLSLDRDEDGTPIIRSPGLRSKLRVGLAFFISYFEHGQCVWSLRGTGPQCRFDSVSVAGLLVWEHKPGDMGARTREARAKDAAGFLTSYTAWCNGDTWYYRVEDEDGEALDACGGFLGPDVGYMFDTAVASVEARLSEPTTFEGDYDEAEDEWGAAVERLKARKPAEVVS